MIHNVCELICVIKYILKTCIIETILAVFIETFIPGALKIAKHLTFTNNSIQQILNTLTSFCAHLKFYINNESDPIFEIPPFPFGYSKDYLTNKCLAYSCHIFVLYSAFFKD